MHAQRHGMSHSVTIFGLIVIVSSQPVLVDVASGHGKLHVQEVDDAVHEALELYATSPKSLVATQIAEKNKFDAEVLEAGRFVSDAVHAAESEFGTIVQPHIMPSHLNFTETTVRETCAERSSRLVKVAARDQKLLDEIHAKLAFLNAQADLQQTNVNKLMMLTMTYKTAEAKDALDEALSKAHYAREAGVSVERTSKLLEQRAALSYTKAAKAAEECTKAHNLSQSSFYDHVALLGEGSAIFHEISAHESSASSHDGVMEEVQEYSTGYSIEKTMIDGALHYFL